MQKNTDLIFKKLAVHLDDLPAGFPPGGDGLELRLLQKLFTPEDAELAIHITLIPEDARVVAWRAKRNPEQVAQQLKEMAFKGLIFSIEQADKPPLYMANQMVIGIWEYHVQNLDPDLIHDMNAYIPALLKEAWKVPQLRTIPVNRSISPQLEVMTYENAEEMIRRHKKLVVAPCICRRERTMVGEGCNKPEESCLIFGSSADYYVRNGMGRVITQQEALRILQRADEAGLVLQPGNSQRAGNICCCCGCCCGVLRTLKQLPKPAGQVSSPFYAVSDSDTCEGCGTCLERCQIDAVILDNGTAQINRDRCIGCGLCITTCPSNSLTLVRKPSELQPPVLKNSRDTYLKLGRLRNKLGFLQITKLFLKSKIDRLLVSSGLYLYFIRSTQVEN